MTKEQAILINIRCAQNILLLTHVNPDGDTIGCVVAFYFFIKLLDQNKNVKILAQENFNNNGKYKFLNLPQDAILTNTNQDELKRIDLIIACDCGEISRTPLGQLSTNYKCPMINIDHHPNNHLFGNINLIDEKAAATTEIIFELFSNWQIPLNKQIANSLLLGIITDTDSFANLTTTPKTLEIVDKLMSLGANLADMNQKLWYNKNPQALKYWGKILKTVKINKRYGVALIIIPPELLKEINENEPEVNDEFTDFLNYISGIKMAMVIKIDAAAGLIKGSLRTTSDRVDVGLLANILGGGGHQKAAGFSIKIET
ncbi:MAG: bifunctional oligoribonuclease/PAP phosphatase NrnA [Candidatus Falkowbacteria bacterium]